MKIKHFICILACLNLIVAGCETLRPFTSSAKAKIEEQLKLIASDRLNKLVERMDAKIKSPSTVPEPENPVADLPLFVWMFGDFIPQSPVKIWHGKLKSATPNRVEMDYTECPAWFREATTDDNMFEVAAFWKDGEKHIGGKFDWINFPRTMRDLAHTNKPGELYRNWDGRYCDRAPDYVVIVNTQLRE